MARGLDGLQRLGRALMLPIAVLPVAALLLRLGQPDLLNIAELAAAGNAIFANLGMLFAVGVAIGFARENHGAAGLAGLVCFLVATKGAEVLLTAPAAVSAGLDKAAAEVALNAWRAQQLTKLSMPVGLLSGLAAGFCYNRFSEIVLPNYLSFFGGRRFVPIITGLFGVLLATAFGYAWPLLARGMDGLSLAVVHAGPFGLFIYGVLNRLLIVTGLHHILNNIAWLLLGDFHGVTGDLKRFFAGDPAAGVFMSGFFPVMMFGLPGACLAMYRAALPERRKVAGGLLLSIALTSFLTGVTEPIEFCFMFLAPVLYLVHAVLTGTAMVIMQALGVHLGFGFSAGLFDYVLNYSLATRPLLLLPVGAAYFAVYYTLFRVGIEKFNLPTPGREELAPVAAPLQGGLAARNTGLNRAARLVVALGGAGNLRNVDACTTRLRLTVVDAQQVDVAALTQAGALGVVRPSATTVQVVLGPIADQVAGEIRNELRGAESGGGVALGAYGSPASVDKLLQALGGADNLLGAEHSAGRVLVRVVAVGRVSRAGLDALLARGHGVSGHGLVHLLCGPESAAVAAALARHARAAVQSKR